MLSQISQSVTFVEDTLAVYFCKLCFLRACSCLQYWFYSSITWKNNVVASKFTVHFPYPFFCLNINSPNNSWFIESSFSSKANSESAQAWKKETFSRNLFSSQFASCFICKCFVRNLFCVAHNRKICKKSQPGKQKRICFAQDLSRREVKRKKLDNSMANRKSFLQSSQALASIMIALQINLKHKASISLNRRNFFSSPPHLKGDCHSRVLSENVSEIRYKTVKR